MYCLNCNFIAGRILFPSSKVAVEQTITRYRPMKSISKRKIFRHIVCSSDRPGLGTIKINNNAI